MSSTGKSISVSVRACVRAVGCRVEIGDFSTSAGFPFSLFPRQVFPFPFSVFPFSLVGFEL